MHDLILQLAAMPPVAPAPIPVGGSESGAAALNALPMGVHTTAVAGLIAGLLLWALGGRMIKLTMAIFGAALGAGIGSMLVPTLGLTAVAGFPAHLVGLAGGAILGLVAAFLLFRFAMVIAGAGVVGCAAALGGLVYVNVAPPPADMQTPSELAPIVEWHPDAQPSESPDSTPDADPGQVVRDLIQEQAQSTAEQEATAAGDSLRSMVSDDTAAAVEEAAERVRAFVHAFWRSFINQWNNLDAAQRLVLAGFVVVGLAAGALIGLAMPARSAAMLTSLAGSAVWLASLAWLAEAMELPGRHLLTVGGHTSLRWLIIWPTVAAIGLLFQLKNLKKSDDSTRGSGGRTRRRGQDNGREDRD